jgi:hypothetical protein
MRTQRALLSETREAFTAVDARARQLMAGIGDGQLIWRPPDGGWGIDQVLEHIAVTNEQFLGKIRACLSNPRTPTRKTGDAEWRPTLAGKFLAYVMRNPRKAPAPSLYRPGPSVRPHVLEGFLRSHLDLQTELERASNVDLRRARTTSPVSGLIPLNLGDCFEVLALHSDRHLSQIERIKKRPDFPANSS